MKCGQNPSNGSVLILLSDSEVSKGLTYVNVALSGQNDQTHAYDLLKKDKDGMLCFLEFSFEQRELAIRVLTLMMQAHGLECNFAEEERILHFIESIESKHRPS